MCNEDFWVGGCYTSNVVEVPKHCLGSRLPLECWYISAGLYGLMSWKIALLSLFRSCKMSGMLVSIWTLPCSFALSIFLWSLDSPIVQKFVVNLEGPSLLSVLLYTVTIRMMQQNFFINRTGRHLEVYSVLCLGIKFVHACRVFLMCLQCWMLS